MITTDPPHPTELVNSTGANAVRPFVNLMVTEVSPSRIDSHSEKPSRTIGKSYRFYQEKSPLVYQCPQGAFDDRSG